MPDSGQSPVVEMEGAEALMRWFGFWPSFHDAEILDVHLVRGDVSWLRVFCWASSGRLEASGHYVREKMAVVTFEMTGLRALELTDFSIQNVVSSMRLERLPDGWRLSLDPTWGICGFLEAEEMRVRVAPLEGSPDLTQT